MTERQPGSDPIGELQRWLVRSGARSVTRGLGDQVRTALGGNTHRGTCGRTRPPTTKPRNASGARSAGPGASSGIPAPACPRPCRPRATRSPWCCRTRRPRSRRPWPRQDGRPGPGTTHRAPGQCGTRRPTSRPGRGREFCRTRPPGRTNRESHPAWLTRGLRRPGTLDRRLRRGRSLNRGRAGGDCRAGPRPVHSAAQPRGAKSHVTLTARWRERSASRGIVKCGPRLVTSDHRAVVRA